MSARDDEDPIYNRNVLKEIRESAQDREERSTEIKDIRTAIFRAINLLHIEVVALKAAVERWQWVTIGIVAGLLIIVIISMSVMLYIVIRR